MASRAPGRRSPPAGPSGPAEAPRRARRARGIRAARVGLGRRARAARARAPARSRRRSSARRELVARARRRRWARARAGARARGARDRRSRRRAARVTLIAADGRVLADSDVPTEKLAARREPRGAPRGGGGARAGEPGLRCAAAPASAGASSTSPSRRRRAAARCGVAADLVHDRPRGRGRSAASSCRRRRRAAGAPLPPRLLLVRTSLRVRCARSPRWWRRSPQGELDRPAPARRPGDEFGRIAAAVNEMAEQLRARLRELTRGQGAPPGGAHGHGRGRARRRRRAARRAREPAAARALRASGRGGRTAHLGGGAPRRGAARPSPTPR